MDILGEILKQVLESATQAQQTPQRAPQPQQRSKASVGKARSRHNSRGSCLS